MTTELDTMTTATDHPLDARLATLALHGGPATLPKPVAFMKPQLERADIDAAHAVLESGMLRSARQCETLENRFATISDATHALTCANGTCALQLAYEALLQPGDEVLVPAWTYIATASMLVARGCKPIFVDSLEDTFQVDIEDCRRRVTPNTKAIACTHLYGIPVDIDAVQAFAAEHNLKVIYDAAQAHLSTYKGKGIGAFGDAVTYSFYATKNLGTGEGGMVTTNDPATARTMSLLRSHGETDKYLHEMVGYNYRMNDITGAIGNSRLDRLPAETKQRQQAAERYTQLLSTINGIIPPAVTPGAESAWHLYVIKLDLDIITCTRDVFADALRAEGVPCAVHYPRSLTDQPAFAHVVTDHPPVARSLARRVIALPMHHALTQAEIEGVCEAVAKIAAAYSA